MNNNSMHSKRKTIDSNDHHDHALDHDVVVTESMSNDPNARFVTTTTTTTTKAMENEDTDVDEHQHHKQFHNKKRRLSGDRETNKDSEVDPDVPAVVDPMKGLMAMSFPVKLHLLIETYEKERKERLHKKEEEEKLESELKQKALMDDNNEQNDDEKMREEEDDTATINTVTTTGSCTSCTKKFLKSIPIIEWHANGKSFKIHDETRFVTELIPRYCTSCSSSLHAPVPPSSSLRSRSRSQSRSSSLGTEHDEHAHEHAHEHTHEHTHEHEHHHGHEHEHGHARQEQLQPSFHNFERNLNLWGFNHMLRVEGPYQQRCTVNGSIRSITRKVHICSHPFFQKQNRELCKSIKFIGDRFIDSDGTMNTTATATTQTKSSHRSSSNVAVASSLCLAIINTKNVL